jgi:hypothetical protein
VSQSVNPLLRGARQPNPSVNPTAATSAAAGYAEAVRRTLESPVAIEEAECERTGWQDAIKG